MPQILYTNNLTTSAIKLDIAKTIAELEPQATQLTLITQMLNKKSSNTYFEEHEEELPVLVDTVVGAVTAIAVTIVVANVTRWKANDVLRTPSGEITLITLVTAATSTLTVVRQRGSVASAAIANGAVVQNLGPNYDEGAATVTAWSEQPTALFNYCETIEHAWQMSRQAANQQMNTNEGMKYREHRTLMKHAIAKETKFLMGQRFLDTTTSAGPRYFTGGIDEFIVTNRFDIGQLGGGYLTSGLLDDVLRSCLEYGSTKKTMVCSTRVSSVLSSFAQDKLQNVRTEKSIGMVIKDYQSASGQITILEPHRLFSRLGWDDRAYILDFDLLGYRYVPECDTFIKRNVQANQAMQEMHMVMSTVGLFRSLEKAHGMFLGVIG